MARKILAGIGSVLLLLWVAAPLAAAQDGRSMNMFKDVEPSHWAYPAVETLRARSIVAGYPEGYFRGKRPLTRYEFAIAIDRALKTASAQLRQPGNGALDPPLDARDVDSLRRLAREFQDELASLGSDEKATAQVLDSLARRSAATGGSPKPPDSSAGDSAGSGSILAPRPTLSSVGAGGGPAFTLRFPLAVSSTRPPQLTLGRLSQDFGSLGLDTPGSAPDRRGLLLPPARPLDGANVSARVGSLGLQAYYGSLGTPDFTDPATLGLLDGAFSGPAGFSHSNGLGPAGAYDIGGLGAARAAGVAGSVGFHLFDRAAHLRISASSVSGPQAGAAGGAGDITVVGADSDIQLAKRLTLSAEWARSLSGSSRFFSGAPADTNAFNAMVAYNAAGLNLSAGYRYVDPLFSTAGYWGRIGNWLNPTNIQGPTFRASYNLSSNLGLTLGGDYFTAARDSSPLGLDANEDITRALLGVRWGLSRSLNLTADYEGVFWSLNGSRGAGTGMFHPTEHYLTLGTGYSLTGSTLLRFNYQIGDFDGHGALSNGSSTRSKYNAFVGQVSVKF